MRMKLILVLLAIVGLLSLQACGRKIDPETSCNFVQNSSMQRVSWNEDIPVRIYVHKSVPAEHHQAIRDAALAWNVKLGKTIIEIEGFNIDGPAVPKRDSYSMIYWLTEWEENRSTEQARTTVYWSGTRIYEADIRINEKDFDFFSGDEPDSSSVDMLKLMIHEFGHVLGLSHNESTHSVMKSSLATGVNNDRRDVVGPVDISSLECEY